MEIKTCEEYVLSKLAAVEAEYAEYKETALGAREADAIKAEIADLKIRLSEAERERDTLREESESTHMQLSAVESELKETKAALDSATHGDVAKLKAEAERAIRVAEEAKTVAAEAQAKREEVEDTINQQLKTINTLTDFMKRRIHRSKNNMIEMTPIVCGNYMLDADKADLNIVNSVFGVETTAKKK